MLDLKFKNTSNNPDPDFATVGSSGFDLRANLESSILLPPRERVVVPTGLFFDIPDHYEIQVRSRSGLAAKNGIKVLNSPGTVDSDYTGEMKIILYNSDKNNDFIINHGDRIAQGVLAIALTKGLVNLTKVDEIIEKSERGSGGFGSTGMN